MKTLIKLHKHILNEKQRRLAEIQNQQSTLQTLKAQLVSDLEYEQSIAIQNPETSYSFVEYALNVNKRCDSIEVNIATLQSQLDIIRNEIYESFAELKKYEIAYTQHQERQAKEIAYKEAMELDEIGIRNFQSE